MDIQKNYDYSVRLISNAFESVTDILVVDFLSSYTHPDYPVEDSVFYHDPFIIFSNSSISEVKQNIDITNFNLNRFEKVHYPNFSNLIPLSSMYFSTFSLGFVEVTLETY